MFIPRAGRKAVYLRRMLAAALGATLLAIVSACAAIPSTKMEPSQSPVRAPAPSPTPTPVPVQPGPATSGRELTSYIGELRPVSRVTVVSKTGGRVQELKAAVGDRVKKDALLAVLEHRSPEAQVKQAEAALAAAEASLAKVEAGPRAEQVAAAEATLAGVRAALDILLAGASKEQVATAEASVNIAQRQLEQAVVVREGAKQSWEDAQKARANPQELDAKIDAARAGLEAARHQVAKAEIAKDNLQFVAFGVARPSGWQLAGDGVARQAEEDIQLARVNRDAAQKALDNLLALRQNPIAVDAAVNAAQARYDQAAAAVLVAEAGRDQASAQLVALKAPPKPEQVVQLLQAIAAAQQQLKLAQAPFTAQDVEVARAQVSQAQAGLELARARRDEAFVRSPLDGYVAARGVSVGDLAVGEPYATTLFVVVSSEVEVAVAVDERAVRQFKVGQPVQISVPVFPERVFEGSIKAVAPAANPATRTFEVFASVPDPQGLFRSGMSATLTLAGGETGGSPAR